MGKQLRQVEFSKLRHAYVTIKAFLEKEAGEKVTSLEIKIAKDLSLLGDDNYDLLEKFVEKFELGYTNFEYDRHFYEEWELFGSGAAIQNLLILSIWLPMKTIELLSFNELKLSKPEFYKPDDREAIDMTFKDLLTWYIEGDYTTADEIKYELQN